MSSSLQLEVYFLVVALSCFCLSHRSLD